MRGITKRVTSDGQVRYLARAHRKPGGARTFDRHEDAERWLNEQRRHRQLGHLYVPAPSKTTLDAYLDEWERRGEREWARGTQLHRHSVLRNHVRPQLGGYQLAELNVALIQAWHDRLTEQTTPGAVNKARACLRAALNEATRRQLIPANPALTLTKVREPETGGRALTVLEVERVRWQLRDDARAVALVCLLAYSGLRCQEALALTWSDLTPNTRVTVRRAWTARRFKGTKTGKPRVVALTPPLRDDLEAYAATTTPARNALVFPGRDPEKPLSLEHFGRHVWTPAREDARVEFAQLRDLRHTYASLRLADRASLPNLQAEMGHSSWTTTMTHYAYEYEVAQHDPSVPIDKAIKRARTQAHAEGKQRQRERHERRRASSEQSTRARLG